MTAENTNDIMKRKTIEELKAEHAAEIAALERENKLRAALAGVPGVNPDDCSMCAHESLGVTFYTVKLWDAARSLSAAVAVVEHFAEAIVEGEHWNDGCVSDWPKEINTCGAREKSTMEGAHAVEIGVSGGRGYGPDVVLQFWTKLDGILCELSCPLSDQWQLVPTVRGNYDKEGCFSGSVGWDPTQTQTVDSFRKFWSEAPNYKGSYYLAGVPNFKSWASNHVKPTGKA